MMPSSQLGSTIYLVFGGIRFISIFTRDYPSHRWWNSLTPGIGTWELPTDRSLAHSLLDRCVIQQHTWQCINNISINVRL